MSATELLCNLVGLKPCELSKEENIIIEAELFARVCEELYVIHKSKYTKYFQTIKFDKDREIEMIEESFSRCIINDILASKEYTLSGIAQYTQIPEEIVTEIASGNIAHPSILFFRKIVELHRSVRSELYRAIMDKIIGEYSGTNS